MAADAPSLAPYAPGAGEDRYIRFSEDIFGLDLSETQERIHRAVANHRKVLIVSGNGVGKSYGVSSISGGFLFCNPNSTVNITSGSYSVLEDTIWRPLKGLHKHAKQEYGLPGRRLESPPQLLTELDDEWYLKAISPRNPDDLEGRHNDYMMYVVEEADKPSITQEHIDSAESTITDDRDRMVVIANPPKDESNIVYDLMQKDDWHVVQFSSFESRNVKIDAEIEGYQDKDRIPGLVNLEKIKQNWRSWNQKEWPGFEEARDSRDPALDSRWFRRRLGEIPPSDGTIHRPIYPEHVDEAAATVTEDDEEPLTKDEIPLVRKGIGIDIGHQGGDRTTVIEVRGNHLVVFATEQFNRHYENRRLIDQTMDAAPLKGHLAIDAIGEGSGPADDADLEYPNAFRFKASSNALQRSEYYDKKTEAYDLLGQFLRDGGVVHNDRLLEELYAAGRAMEFTERSVRGDVVLRTTKSGVRDRLGRSPDLLDAASMAVWAMEMDNPKAAGRQSSGMFETNPW